MPIWGSDDIHRSHAPALYIELFFGSDSIISEADAKTVERIVKKSNIRDSGMLIDNTVNAISQYLEGRIFGFDRIDTSENITQEEKETLYMIICRTMKIRKIRDTVRRQLAELDAKRAAQKTDTLDDLIDNL